MSDNPREAFAAALRELTGDPERVRRFLEPLFEDDGLVKTVYADITCECGKRKRHPVEVTVPNFKAKKDAILALDKMMTQSLGAPKATSVVEVNVSARRISELSDDQLAAIAGGGSLGELPPAA